jgi:hypothetical protein
MSVYAPSLTNIFQIGSSSFYKYKPVTLMESVYMQKYLLYLNLNIENNAMITLNYIPEHLITTLSNIYSKSHIKNIKLTYNFVKDKELMKMPENINKNTVDLQNAIVNFSYMINLLSKELQNNVEYKFDITDLLT